MNEPKANFWSFEARKGFVLPITVAFVIWAGGFFKETLNRFAGQDEHQVSVANKISDLSENNKRNWDKYNELEGKVAGLNVDVTLSQTNQKDIARLEAHLQVIESRMNDSRETNAAQSEAIHKLQDETIRRK